MEYLGGLALPQAPPPFISAYKETRRSKTEGEEIVS